MIGILTTFIHQAATPSRLIAKEHLSADDEAYAQYLGSRLNVKISKDNPSGIMRRVPIRRCMRLRRKS